MNSVFKILAASAALASVGFAQTTSVVIPAVAGVTEGNNTGGSRVFDQVSFRAQVVYEYDAIAPVDGLINVLWIRQDVSNSNSTIHWGGGYYPSLKIEMSETTVTPTAMTTTYAANESGGIVTTVFDGPFQMPELDGYDGHVNEWIPITLTTPYFFVNNGNNLLVNIVADNPLAPPFTNEQRFNTDGAQPGGYRRFFGETGPNVDNLQISINSAPGSGGSGTWGGLAVDGGVNVRAVAGSAGISGAFFYGFAELASPISLAGLGAPGNNIYIDGLIDLGSFTTAFPPIGFDAVADHNIFLPNDPVLAYQTHYFQIAYIRPAANPLMLVFTRAAAVTLGDDKNELKYRQLDSSDPLSATGFLRFGSFNGGIATRMTGVFN